MLFKQFTAFTPKIENKYFGKGLRLKKIKNRGANCCPGKFNRSPNSLFQMH